MHSRPPEIHVVFEGKDIQSGLTFVEVEDGHGHSIRVGEWMRREDGYMVLIIKAPE